jgi:hypothetical protein
VEGWIYGTALNHDATLFYDEAEIINDECGGRKLPAFHKCTKNGCNRKFATSESLRYVPSVTKNDQLMDRSKHRKTHQKGEPRFRCLAIGCLHEYIFRDD